MNARLTLGVALWRGGLLLAGGWTSFRVARAVLRYVDLPWAIEVGVALVVAGFVLLIASIVLENLDDRGVSAHD